MADHRIRFNDSDLELVVAALRARQAGVSTATAHRLQRLIDRLEDGGSGNPQWRFADQRSSIGTAAR